MITNDSHSLMGLSCFASNLRRAERAVYRLYADEIRGGGLEPTQFSLLMVIRRAGEISQGDIAAGLVIDSTTLSRTLATLRGNGWVESREDETDRRRKLYAITEKGRRELEAAVPYWERAQERLRRSIGEEAWSTLMSRLVDLTVAAERA